MAVLEASLYSAGIAIILASIYVLKFCNIDISQLALHVAVKVGLRPQKLDIPEEIRTAKEEEEPKATKFSSGWWADEKQFQLERRAVFSKSWLLVTHISRFQKPGDYRTFEVAGFSFIVILGKDKQLRGFHNVCRHRAYAVTKKESGSSTVLGCRYHGWSYDTKGKLIKAPEFENVAGFDKAMNGLWELKMEVREGMVFVNFDVGNGNRRFEMRGLEDNISSWKVGDMKWVHEWKVEGAFNWKLAGNSFLNVSSEKSSWAWALPSILQGGDERVVISHTAVLRRLASGSLLMLRALPLSPQKTLIECTIYGRSSRSTKKARLELESAKTEVRLEIEQLELQQKSLLEKGSDFQNFEQEELNEILARHIEQEKQAGREIHPAARKQSFTEEGTEDDDLCTELEKNNPGGFCGANARGLLDW